MAEPDASQFSDRPTPEPLNDLAVEPPLLVAPPLGINRQFLVPLGARSLTVLEPDLFQPRSSYEDSSLFGESPFFHDPLLPTPAKPVAQSSSTERSSASGEAVVQRSTTAHSTQSIQHETDLLLSQAHLPSTGSIDQPGESFELEPSAHPSATVLEHQGSEAIEPADFSQAVPAKPTANQEPDHHAWVTPSEISTSPEISLTVMAKVEDSSPPNSPLTKGLENVPSIEPPNRSTPPLANEVQRSTTFNLISEPESALIIDPKPSETLESKAQSVFNSQAKQGSTTQLESTFSSQAEHLPESLGEATFRETPFNSTPDVQPQVMSEHASALTIDSKPDATIESEAKSTVNSQAKHIPETQVESAFSSQAEHISESVGESTLRETPFNSTPDVQPQIAFGKPATDDRFETVSTSVFQPDTTTQLTASDRPEVASAPTSKLTGVFTEASSNSVGAIEEQTTAVPQASTPETTLSSPQGTPPLEAVSTATASSKEPGVINRQVASETQPTVSAEQQTPSLESSPQRSLAVDLPTASSQNELAPTATENPNAEVTDAAVEPLQATPSATEATTVHPAQPITLPTSNPIDLQPASSIAPVSFLQAKELEPLPSSSQAFGSEVHSTFTLDAALPVTKPKQFVAETTGLADLELQTKPTDAQPTSSSAQEALSAYPSNTSISVTPPPHVSSTELANKATIDEGEVLIAPQSPSQVSPLSHILQAKDIQAKERDPSPEPSIGIAATEQHSASHVPTSPLLEQSNQFAESPALTALEPPEERQGMSEVVSQSSQSPLDPLLRSSTDRISLAQTTPSLEGDVPQVAQMQPQQEAPASIARLIDSTEATAIAHPAKHEALLKPFPLSDSSSSNPLNLQLKSTETATETVFIQDPLAIGKAGSESRSELSTEQPINADRGASQSNEASEIAASNNQTQPLEPQSKTLYSAAPSSIIETLENAQAASEGSIQRTPTPSLDSSISSSASIEVGPTEAEPFFNAQSFNSKPEVSSHIHQAESRESEANASKPNLEEPSLADFPNQEEASQSHTSVSEQLPNLGASLESVDHNLTLDPVSLMHRDAIDPKVDSDSISGSPSESTVIQAKEHPAFDRVPLEGSILETSRADANSTSSDIISDSEVPLKVQSSDDLAKVPQANPQPLSQSNRQNQNTDTSNPEKQNPKIQSPALDSPEIERLDTHSLQAKKLEIQSAEVRSSDAQNLQAQSLEPQNSEFFSKPAVIHQTESSRIQASIDSSTAVITASSSTIDQTVEATDQNIDLADNTVNAANTEANLTHFETHATTANIDAVSNQDAAENYIDVSTEINLGTASNQDVVQKWEEPGATRSIDSSQSAPLPEVAATSIVSTSQSLFLQQAEVQQAPSALDTAQPLPVPITHEGVLASGHAATVQRTSEASTDFSKATDRHAMFDPSHTSSSGLTEPSFARSTEPLPHTSDQPEVQVLPDVQHPVQSASDAALVQLQPVSPALLSSNTEPSSADVSSVTPVDSTTEGVIAQPSFLTPEAIAHSPTVMRSSDLPHPELETPSSPDATPAELLEPGKQATSTSGHDSVSSFFGSAPSSEPGHELDRLSLGTTATHSAHEANVGADVSIQDALSTDTSAASQQQSAQTDAAQEAIVHTPASSPSFLAEAPIQRQVSSSAEVVSQPTAIDSLETQHSQSSLHRVVPFVDSASQPLAADSLEVQRREASTPPHATPLAETNQPLAGHSLETQYTESFTASQVTPIQTELVTDLAPNRSPSVPLVKEDAEGRGIASAAFTNQIGITPLADAAIQPLAADSLEVQQSDEPLASLLETAETLSLETPSRLETPSLQASESNLAQLDSTDLPQSLQQPPPLSIPSPENPLLQNPSLSNLAGSIASETVSQTTAPTNLVETIDKTMTPAIAQRMLGAEQVELDAFKAVHNASPSPEAPIETTSDNPVSGLSQVPGNAGPSEASTTLPLVLQPLSTLEPLTSSANFFSRASATPPTVQASSQSTQQPNSTPTVPLPSSKQVVKVDRSNASWSNFSDLVQRQIIPSARSSDRSRALQATAPHSVAAALASTGEMIQRQPDQPETVRISGYDQTQSTAEKPPEAVDAKDLEQLAQVIYQQLRQRLRIEQERHGRDGIGRLPW